MDVTRCHRCDRLILKNHWKEEPRENRQSSNLNKETFEKYTEYVY